MTSIQFIMDWRGLDTMSFRWPSCRRLWHLFILSDLKANISEEFFDLQVEHWVVSLISYGKKYSTSIKLLCQESGYFINGLLVCQSHLIILISMTNYAYRDYQIWNFLWRSRSINIPDIKTILRTKSKNHPH